MMLHRAQNDMIDASEPAEQIENAEATDPIEATERTDPTEPIESTEPREPSDNSESCDQSDHLELPDDASTATILVTAVAIEPAHTRTSRFSEADQLPDASLDCGLA